jgi:hypothetical protein
MHENREAVAQPLIEGQISLPANRPDFAAQAAGALDPILVAAYQAGDEQFVRMLAAVRGLLIAQSFTLMPEGRAAGAA